MKFQILRSKSTSQPFYWVVKSSNGQVLATSETYVSKEGAKSAIAAVQTGAASATVEDLS
jgi:hypothetical protein